MLAKTMSKGINIVASRPAAYFVPKQSTTISKTFFDKFFFGLRDCGSAKSVLVFLRIYVFWYSLILWKDSFKVGAVIAEYFIHENRLYMYRLLFKFSQERVSRTSANLISYVAPVITLAARDWNLCSLCFNNFPTEESSYRNTVALGLYIILAVYQLVQQT